MIPRFPAVIPSVPGCCRTARGVARFLLFAFRAVFPALIGEKESAMRRVMQMVVAAMFVFGTVGTAQAQVVRFTATMSGNQETPAPGVITGAFGNAVVTLDLATQVVTWNIDVFNMPSGTNNAHFHVGGPGVGGPTVVNIAFPPSISNDFNLSGSATSANLTIRADQGIRSWDDFMQSLLGGQMYLNVHSANNPGGEVRGQLVRVP
jgi:CHRD domain